MGKIAVATACYAAAPPFFARGRCHMLIPVCIPSLRQIRARGHRPGRSTCPVSELGGGRRPPAVTVSPPHGDRLRGAVTACPTLVRRPTLVPSLPTRRTRNPATLGGSQTSHKPNPCTQPGTHQPSTHYRHATRSYPARLMTTTTATPFPSTPTTPLAFIASAAIAFYPPRQNAALLPVPLLLLCLTTRHRPAIITLLSASRPHQ